MEALGGVAMLEEAHHCERALSICRLATLSLSCVDDSDSWFPASAVEHFLILRILSL